MPSFPPGTRRADSRSARARFSTNSTPYRSRPGISGLLSLALLVMTTPAWAEEQNPQPEPPVDTGTSPAGDASEAGPDSRPAPLPEDPASSTQPPSTSVPAASPTADSTPASPAASAMPLPVPDPVTDLAAEREELSEEDRRLLEMAEGEVIEVWAERPDKPFDRDTTVRLTGVELSERGVTNLAEALELVPEINVRFSGRGGRILDIRGARKGSIKILVDGIPVADPFYGTFDVSSIPVTDIVQVRVSTSPSSPIDGLGGPGGVVEVHTRDAIGKRRIDTRVLGSSSPEAQFSATARSQLGEHWAVRPSVSAALGTYDFAFSEGPIDENRHDITGATRIEYRRGTRRLVTDLSIQTRRYAVSPKELENADIRIVDGETGGRVGVVADDQFGVWRVQGNAFAQVLDRESHDFTPELCPRVPADPPIPGCPTEEVDSNEDRVRLASAYENYQMDRVGRIEDLSATRIGAGFLTNRSLRERFQLIGSAVLVTESATATNTNFMSNNPRPIDTGGRSTITELAAGLQWEDGPLRIDSAAGVAVPIDVGAAPWPEVKIAAWYRVMPGLQLRVTGARKGRLPTLRERYTNNVGNEDLDPEQAWFGEVATTIDPRDWLRLEASAWVRDTVGLIKVGTLDGGGVGNTNLGDLTFRGADVQLILAPRAPINLGGSWNHVKPTLNSDGSEPLDFLPRNRASVWLRGTRGQRFGSTIRMTFTDEQVDQNEVLPTRTLFDLTAYATLWGGLSANLRVDNLLDERYLIRAGVESVGRVFMLSLYGGWE